MFLSFCNNSDDLNVTLFLTHCESVLNNLLLYCVRGKNYCCQNDIQLGYAKHSTQLRAWGRNTQSPPSLYRALPLETRADAKLSAPLAPAPVTSWDKHSTVSYRSKTGHDSKLGNYILGKDRVPRRMNSFPGSWKDSGSAALELEAWCPLFRNMTCKQNIGSTQGHHQRVGAIQLIDVANVSSSSQ